MTAAIASPRWLILAAYPLLGLALGLADPGLGHLAQKWGVNPGVATAVSVNVLLPLAAVALGLAHARLGFAWLGAAAMTLGLILGLAVNYGQNWSFTGVLRSVPPVLVVAAFGYAILGSVAAVALRARQARFE